MAVYLRMLAYAYPCAFNHVEHVYSLDGVFVHVHVAVLENLCEAG